MTRPARSARTPSSSAPGTTAWSRPTCSPTPGWDVLVLEATAVPGGAVRSAEVTAPGYLSDLYSSFYPLGYASPVLDGLDLGRHGLSWTARPGRAGPPAARRPGRGDQPGSGRHGRLAGAVRPRRRRALAERVRRLARRWPSRCSTPSPAVPAGPRRARPAAPTAGRAARCGWPAGCVLPVRKLGDELFDGEGGPALLAGCALHTDLSPEEAGSGVYGWLLAMLGQQVGWPVPVGGAQRITDALVARLQERGGRDRLRRPGRPGAHRPGPGDGGTHRRRRRLAGPPGGARRRARPGALPRPGRRGAAAAPAGRGPGALPVGRLHAEGRLGAVRAGAVDQPGGGRRRHRAPRRRPRRADPLRRRTGPRRDAPATRSCWSGRCRMADPSHSPAGHRVALVVHPPAVPAALAGRGHRRARGADGGRAGGGRARASGSSVVGRHVAGPADLEKGDPSLVGGALGGGTAAAYQQLFLRPIPGLGRADTPVDRLFLASSSAHPGGGVHGAPGANAARAALARDRALTGAPTRRRSRTPTDALPELSPPHLVIKRCAATFRGVGTS